MTITTLLAIFATAAPAIPAAADLVVTSTHITTSNAAQPSATGFAVRDGRFVYIGTAKAARKLAGPKTKILELGETRVLPGLVDAHVHPIGIVDPVGCDLNSEPKTLREIAMIVRDCIVRYPPRPGMIFTVSQWNFASGNQADQEYPTLRAALDKAAPNVPVRLLGNDGHHGAYNSAALKLAALPGQPAIGLSKATLAGPFAKYREFVGVDAAGEPSGGINEAARTLMGGKAVDVSDMAAVMANPQAITKRLNAAGITAFLDAAADPESFVAYDTLAKNGQLSAHASLAQFYDPGAILKPDGTPDYDQMVADAVKWRDHYARDPLIRADVVKLFADGVLEGNPLATPPTLPNSPSLRPYHQPIFGRDKDGRATFDGRYVDPQGAACAASKAALSGDTATGDFIKAYGFHPAQCLVGSGTLQHPRDVIMTFVDRMHKAGLALHIHAIGDAAVRTAVDALAAARKGEAAGARRPDTLAHLQLVAPEDVTRIGAMRLYLAMTYAWIYTDKEYDLTVVPFVDRVSGDSYAALHSASGYYERNAYPAGAMQRAGAVLVAGSDAPVETRDPRPFVNMQIGILRARGGTPALGPVSERLTIGDLVRAYTIDGARSLGRDDDFGSIAVGKSADFITLDRDIMSIKPTEIGDTVVEQTYFQGREVNRRQ